jgi:hypothetical protein
MKKNLLAIVLLVAISFNLYIPQLAFSFNSEIKQKTSLQSFDSDIIYEGVKFLSDTNKINMRNNEKFSPEKPFSYSNTTLNQSVSFDLKPISKRKFSVSFSNKNQAQVAVKIYDVIGNLIIEEKVSGRGYFYKEYDLTFYNTDLFIIEVGNSKYNKTKSLVAG